MLNKKSLGNLPESMNILFKKTKNTEKTNLISK
jgi:hypothetical protein